MAENSAIAWTTSTWNAWMGCLKISDGCAHCYAETLTRNRMGLDVWGPAKTTSRQRTSVGNWKKPLRWNREAAKSGQPYRVFCGSLMDWAEDHPQLDPWRKEMWQLIRDTPHLQWQLLTKRADRIAELLPDDWWDGYPNVWLGTSVENQEWADKRIPDLLSVPAAVHFVSVEPVLGPVDLSHWLSCARPIRWTIAGGESGPGFRPMKMEWARALRDQCVAAGSAFFMKQDSAFRTETRTYLEETDGSRWVWKQYPGDLRPPERIL